MITRALADQPLPVYGDGMNVRDWLHVVDHAEAIWTVLTCGKVGTVYNIGGQCEVRNLEIVRQVLRLLGKPESLIRFVGDRPGHDRRYAMSITKMQRELGWRPRHRLEDGIRGNGRVSMSPIGRGGERVLSEAYRAANAMYLRERRERPPSSTWRSRGA